jgi:hypothetical protein
MWLETVLVVGVIVSSLGSLIVLVWLGWEEYQVSQRANVGVPRVVEEPELTPSRDGMFYVAPVREEKEE